MAIPKGGFNDYGIPKARGVEYWNSESKGGLSILEFPKARGGLDEDAARGRVWIFSGITHYAKILNPTLAILKFLKRKTIN